MRSGLAAACLAALLAPAALAQDERRVASPDGKLEFRIFVTPQESGLSRLAYEVAYTGKPILATSLLGLTIHNQEPLLGENDGLTGSRSGRETGRYNWLVAEYMQNGSIGRRINVEARVWNNGIAFRYVIPQIDTAGGDSDRGRGYGIQLCSGDHRLVGDPARDARGVSVARAPERDGLAGNLPGGIGRLPAGFPGVFRSRRGGHPVTGKTRRARGGI